MGSLFAVVAGRRAKWIVALIWLARRRRRRGAANLPGKFADAEKNESTSFLPGDAESTKALEVVKRLEGGELAPLVIVYHRDGGLTARRPARHRARPHGPQPRRSCARRRRFGRPVFSEDGEAALVIAQITSDGEADTIIDPVEAVRKRMAIHGGGLGGEGHRRRGLLGRRDQGLRGHQRHAAAARRSRSSCCC